MATKTYVKRDIASDVSDRFVLNETAGTSATSTVSASNSIGSVIWLTEQNQPNILTWQGGDYIWRIRITTANSSMTIQDISFFRYDSTGSSIKVTKTVTVNMSCGTTGVKSGTISWNDGTQNPAGAAATDRLYFRARFASSSMTQSCGYGMNLTNNNDEIDTPLDDGTGGGTPVTIVMTVTSKDLQNKFIVKV